MAPFAIQPPSEDGTTYNGTFRDSAPVRRVMRKGTSTREQKATATQSTPCDKPPARLAACSRIQTFAAAKRIADETAFQSWWRSGVAGRGGFRAPVKSADERMAALRSRLCSRVISES